MREETLDHVLLYDHQVLVKRRLRILLPMRWALMLEQLQVAIERPGDLAAVLTALQPGMYYLLMKFIVCIDQLKKYCILRWKTFALIL